MNNQAENLRLLVKKMGDNIRAQIEGQERTTRVFTITSGKGGVGKSNFAVNLALSLAEFGKKVILLDADLGLANIDVILGISPPHNLAHVIAGEKTISEIIWEGPRGLKIIPGGSGMHELANLKEWQLEQFLTNLSHLEGMADYLLIDTGAGLSKTVLSFALAADEIIVVTTTEPTALTDAYGLIKTLRQYRYGGKVELVVNRVQSEEEALTVFHKLRIAINRFLKYSIEFLGVIREDPKVHQAVKEQNPLVISYPNTQASQDIVLLAAKLSNQEYRSDTDSEGIKAFFSKVADYFR